LTRRRLRRFGNVSVITGDAVANLPADGTVFFLYNPFDEATVRRFADALGQRAAESDRSVTIHYLNCKHVAVFEDHPSFIVEDVKVVSGESGSGQRLATVVVR
jgi:hypothetical protein